jgi:hypothetical protein
VDWIETEAVWTGMGTGAVVGGVVGGVSDCDGKGFDPGMSALSCSKTMHS